MQNWTSWHQFLTRQTWQRIADMPDSVFTIITGELSDKGLINPSEPTSKSAAAACVLLQRGPMAFACTDNELSGVYTAFKVCMYALPSAVTLPPKSVAQLHVCIAFCGHFTAEVRRTCFIKGVVHARGNSRHRAMHILCKCSPCSSSMQARIKELAKDKTVLDDDYVVCLPATPADLVPNFFHLATRWYSSEGPIGSPMSPDAHRDLMARIKCRGGGQSSVIPSFAGNPQMMMQLMQGLCVNIACVQECVPASNKYGR